MNDIDVIAAWNANNESSRLWHEITDRERIEFALRLAGKVEKQEPVAFGNKQMTSATTVFEVGKRSPHPHYTVPLFTTPQPCPECEKLKAEREELAAQVTHWKANHASVVEQARILKERPDMPIERVKAYESYVAIQAKLAAAEKVMADWAGAPGKE